MASNAEILKNAILNKQQVRAHYDGYYREICPHVIGWKNGVHHVLVYQFAGDGSTPLPPDGQWKCMDVDKLEILSIASGPWHTSLKPHTKPQTCVGEIEVEVDY